jgi:hypothetical protein
MKIRVSETTPAFWKAACYMVVLELCKFHDAWNKKIFVILC